MSSSVALAVSEQDAQPSPATTASFLEDAAHRMGLRPAHSAPHGGSSEGTVLISLP